MTDDIKRFPLLAPESGGAVTPYDTYRLRRLHDAASTLTRWGGTDVSISFRGGNIEESISHRGARPIASVTGYVTVLVVPVLINEGLKTLHITHDVAVGIGDYRIDTTLAAAVGGSWITVRAHLASDPSRAAYLSLNGSGGGNGTPWRYQIAQMELDVSSATPGPDVLIISMRSRLPSRYTDPTEWWGGATPGDRFPTGVRDHSSFSNFSTDRFVDVGSSSHVYNTQLYREVPPPALGVPSRAISAWDHATTASLLIGARSGGVYAEPTTLRAVDHVSTGADSMHAMIWPPQSDMRDANFRRVAKASIPWGVWRSISIKEEYSPLAYPTVDSLRSGAPASASSYRALRRALRRAISRPRLLWGGNPGIFPATAESSWWHSRGYTLRHIPQSPNYSYNIPAAIAPPYSDGQLRARLLVAGVYQGRTMTNVEPLTFDSWDDAVEAGCTGYVKIGGVEQKINFAALGWSENSHFLTMKELQISVRDSSYPHITCDAGSGHVLREGYLTDEDLGLWQTVDVPLESIDELEFDWSETEESLEWVSGPQSGIAGQAVGGRQVPYLDRCFIFIVGYSLYWVPRSEP